MKSTDNSSPFDRDRIEAIRSMLVQEAAREQPERLVHRRMAMLVSLIVAAVLVSTGGAALALSGRLPFIPAPASPSASALRSPLATPTDTPTPAESSAPAANDAQQILQKACRDFGATFEEKIDVKFPHQESATAAAQRAAQSDPQWQSIADDMSLITSVGERINISHDPTLTVAESNQANQAVTDLQQKCTEAGGAFQLPPD
jgi:hypothetical protein